MIDWHYEARIMDAKYESSLEIAHNLIVQTDMSDEKIAEVTKIPIATVREIREKQKENDSSHQ